MREGGGGGKSKEMGDIVRKDKEKGRDTSVFMDPHLAFISPATHNFLTLIYEWDSITLMPNINCSRFLPVFPPTLCVIAQSPSYIKEK